MYQADIITSYVRGTVLEAQENVNNTKGICAKVFVLPTRKIHATEVVLLDCVTRKAHQ